MTETPRPETPRACIGSALSGIATALANAPTNPSVILDAICALVAFDGAPKRIAEGLTQLLSEWDRNAEPLDAEAVALAVRRIHAQAELAAMEAMPEHRRAA